MENQCDKCGSLARDGAVFCPGCGAWMGVQALGCSTFLVGGGCGCALLLCLPVALPLGSCLVGGTSVSGGGRAFDFSLLFIFGAVVGVSLLLIALANKFWKR